MTEAAAATTTTETTTTAAPAADAPAAEGSPLADAGAVAPAAEGTETAAPAAATPTAAERARAVADRMAARNATRRREAQERIDATNRAATLEQQLHQERQARQASDAQLQRMNDPKTFIDEATKRGVTAKAIAQAQIDENTPEGIARRAMERAEAVAQENARLQAALSQRDSDNAQRAFVEEAKSFDDPYIRGRARANPAILIAEAESLMKEHGPAFQARNGRLPTFHELIKHMSESYAAAQEAPARESDNVTTTTAPTDKAQPNGQSQVVPNSSGTGARTLTNRASEKGALPPNLEQLPYEQQIEAMAAQVRANKARSSAR